MNYTPVENRLNEIMSGSIKYTPVKERKTVREPFNPQQMSLRYEPGRKLYTANISGYSLDPAQTDKRWWEGTASRDLRRELEAGNPVLASRDLPLGTRVKVGDKVYTVLDRMNKRYSGTGNLDILFPTKEEALKFGRQHINVEILDEEQKSLATQISPKEVTGITAADFGLPETEISTLREPERESFFDKLIRGAVKAIQPIVGIGITSLIPKKKEPVKEPTKERQIIMKREDNRLAYLRRKQFEDLVRKEITEDPVMPEDYKEPTTFIGQLEEGIKYGYAGTIKPALGYFVESMGRDLGSRNMIEWGSKFGDKMIIELMKKPELLAPEDMQPWIKNPSDMRYYGRVIGETIPFITTVIGSSIIGGILAGPTGAKVAAYGAVYAVEQANSYKRYIDEGIPPDKATTYSTIYGAISAYIENAMGFKPAKVAESMFAKQATEVVTKSFRTSLFQTIKKTSTQLFQTMLEEGGEETIQQFAENAMSKWYGTVGVELTDNLAEAFVSGFWASLPYGLIPGAAGGPIQAPPIGLTIKDITPNIKRNVTGLQKKEINITQAIENIRKDMELPESQSPVIENIINEAITLFESDKPLTERINDVTSNIANRITALQTKEVKPTIPKELEPLAQEARKYKSAEEFVNATRDKLQKSLGQDAMEIVGLKNIEFSKISTPEAHYKIDLTNKTTRDIVDGFKKGIQQGKEIPPIVLDGKNNVIDGTHKIQAYKELGIKEVPVVRPSKDLSQLTDFYNQAVKGVAEIAPEAKKGAPEAILGERGTEPRKEVKELTTEEKQERKKKRDARLVRKTVKKMAIEEWPEEVKQIVDREVNREKIASNVASRFNSEDLKEFRFLANIFRRTRKLQEGDIDTFLRNPQYGKRLNAALEEISSQMEDPEQPSLYAMSQEDLFEEMLKLAKYTPKELADLGKISKSMEATALSDEWIQRISFFENPPTKRVAIAFALLGNKKTTVPLFREIFTDWVKGGVTTIIKPWGGAFTLPTHSIPAAIEVGLKEFHTNIFDKEKLIIVNTIRDGKIDNVKNSLDLAVKTLHEQLLEESKSEPIVRKAFLQFSKEFPNSYIGSHDWARWARQGQLNSLNSKVRTLKDYYKSFTWVFQNTINSLWKEDVKTLDDALMLSLLKKINRYAHKSQDFVSDGAGFKTKQDSIYGKYGMSQAFEDIERLFKLAKDKGTNIVIHSEDSEKLVKKFKDLDPKTTGWFLDPPYVNEAKRVYGQEKGTEGAAPLEKFTSGEKLYESHKEIFESINKGARGAWTNDLDEKYLDAMNEHLEGARFMAYRELRTPTSLVVDKETEGTVSEFLSQPPSIIKISDEEYLQRRLNTVSGYTNKVINSLIERGFKQEKIDQLRIGNRYFKNILKIKREPKTGRISAIISKEVLNYIRRNYNDKNVSDEWIKTYSPKAIGLETANLVQGLENGSRFFRRLSKEYVDENGNVHTEGLKNIIFDPIRQGERLAVEMANSLRKIELKSVFDLNKKEANELWRYTAIRQGKIKDEPWPSMTFKKLSPKVQKAYMDIRRIAEKYYPQVREAGNIRGLEVGHIANYTPLYTRQDLRQIDEGGIDWTRKDPYFGSVKERVEDVPLELYEKDYRKVMDHWITGLSKYIEVGKRTVPVKYLIDTEEFRDIVGNKMWQRINEWYRYLVNPPKVEGIWKGVRILRSLQATAILGFRDTVILKQFLNWFDFGAAIKFRKLVKGGIKVTRRSQLARIAKTSGSILERSAGLTIQDLRGTIIKWTQKPTVWADRLTAKVGMVAVIDRMIERLKKQGKELNVEEFKRIQRMASDVVDAVMGGMSRAETPKYFRTEGGKNLFMFYSQLNSKMQYYVSDVFANRWKFLNELSGSHKRIVAKAIVTMILGAYLESVITSLAPGDDPDDISKLTLKTLIGNFPLLGNIYYMIESGEPFDVSPILGNILDLVKNISEGKTEDAIWTGTAFFGMPQQVKRIYQGIKITEEGGLKNKKGEYLFRIYNTMDIIRTILRGKWMSKPAKEYIKTLNKKGTSDGSNPFLKGKGGSGGGGKNPFLR